MKWLFYTVILSVVAAWLKGVLSQFLPVPPPKKVRLAFENYLENRWRDPQRPEDSFCIVLCWLENDKTGDETRSVEAAFTGVEGIRLIRSARTVSASGAADEWRPAMQRSALAELEYLNADVAVVGTVKKLGEVLSLWFVPRLGDGTLDRGDRPYKLENVTLGKDFHEDLRAQLSGTAMAAVAPLADTEARGRVLDKGLRDAVEKLSNLLEATTIHRPEHRAALHVTLGNALFALGERENGKERLEQAVNAYRTALQVYTRESAPLDWAMTQTNLGNTLRNLGDRETGTKRLEQAVNAHRAALQVYTRESAPFDWAAAQNNLGNALSFLGEREDGTERLKEAVDAFQETLRVHTRESAPFDWAATQNNLGGALLRLGEREDGTELLKRAVDAFQDTLQVHTRERVPLDWAMTQTNLGNTLRDLGDRETGTKRLEQAVNAHRAALQVYTRERVPLRWAMTQNNLGSALGSLGEREDGTERLKKAVNLYRAALEVLNAEGSPGYRNIVEKNLHQVLKKLQKLQPRETSADSAIPDNITQAPGR